MPGVRVSSPVSGSVRTISVNVYAVGATSSKRSLHPRGDAGDVDVEGLLRAAVGERATAAHRAAEDDVEAARLTGAADGVDQVGLLLGRVELGALDRSERVGGLVGLAVGDSDHTSARCSSRPSRVCWSRNHPTPTMTIAESATVLATTRTWMERRQKVRARRTPAGSLTERNPRHGFSAP